MFYIKKGTIRIIDTYIQNYLCKVNFVLYSEHGAEVSIYAHKISYYVIKRFKIKYSYKITNMYINVRIKMFKYVSQITEYSRILHTSPSTKNPNFRNVFSNDFTIS